MNSLSIRYTRNGFEHTLTLADDDSTELMKRGDLALTWLQTNDAQPVQQAGPTIVETPQRAQAAPNGHTHGNGHAAPTTSGNLCPLHGVPMTAHTKGNQTWFSHQVDGQWCRGK